MGVWGCPKTPESEAVSQQDLQQPAHISRLRIAGPCGQTNGRPVPGCGHQSSRTAWRTAAAPTHRATPGAFSGTRSQRSPQAPEILGSVLTHSGDIPASLTVTRVFLEACCFLTEGVSTGVGPLTASYTRHGKGYCATSEAPCNICGRSGAPHPVPSVPLLNQWGKQAWQWVRPVPAPAVEQLSSWGTRLWPECYPCLWALVNSLHNRPASY